MQSNPLPYVNLYAFNLAARLGDRLGWIFFQTLLDGCNFVHWMLRLLDFQVRFSLKFKKRKEQF